MFHLVESENVTQFIIKNPFVESSGEWLLMFVAFPRSFRGNSAMCKR